MIIRNVEADGHANQQELCLQLDLLRKEHHQLRSDYHQQQEYIRFMMSVLTYTILLFGGVSIYVLGRVVI